MVFPKILAESKHKWFQGEFELGLPIPFSTLLTLSSILILWLWHSHRMGKVWDFISMSSILGFMADKVFEVGLLSSIQLTEREQMNE